MGRHATVRNLFGELKELDGVSAEDAENPLNTHNGNMDCFSSEFTVSSLSWPESKVSLELRDRKLSAALSPMTANGYFETEGNTIDHQFIRRQKRPNAAWLNTMGYQILKVDASMIDEQPLWKANLDNMSFAMQGSLDQDTGRIDLNGTVTIAQASEDQLIQVDLMLVDPLAFYCKGSTTEPDCGPDTKKASSIVGDLMKREGKRLLRKEAEEALESLEEKLPDGLKESARQLLNLFR